MPLVVTVTSLVFVLLLLVIPAAVLLKDARAKIRLAIEPTKVELPHSCPACDGSMERGFVLPSGQLGWSKDGTRKVFAGLLEPLIPPGMWRHPVRPALRCTDCGIALVHYAAPDPA